MSSDLGLWRDTRNCRGSDQNCLKMLSMRLSRRTSPMSCLVGQDERPTTAGDLHPHESSGFSLLS
ncbi:unnamed protein product [Ixodes pacificus]